MPNITINVFYDNKYAISLTKSKAHNFKGRHIDLNYFYI